MCPRRQKGTSASVWVALRDSASLKSNVTEVGCGQRTRSERSHSSKAQQTHGTSFLFFQEPSLLPFHPEETLNCPETKVLPWERQSLRESGNTGVLSPSHIEEKGTLKRLNLESNEETPSIAGKITNNKELPGLVRWLNG